MYTTVRQYRGDPADMDEIVRRVDEVFAEEIAKLDGFVGYEFVDCGDGTVVTITVFEDASTAEHSTELAAKFIRDQLQGMPLERQNVWNGTLRVNRAGSHMTDMVHA